MTNKPEAKVYSIAPGVPFLTTLAKAVRDGSLGFGATDPRDPLALASTTIYVPTRRAARALRAAFAEAQTTSSAILPTIKPLGEFDEDLSFVSVRSGEPLSLAPSISSDERVLSLARLTMAWSRELAASSHTIFRDEPVLLPRTSADAIWLARDLASVIDELELQDVEFSRLKELDPQTLSGWWQITRDFLEIVTETFPKHLAEKQLSNPVAYRNAMIRAEAKRLENYPPEGPVIAAGSTGSIPATAELLRVIAHLPRGVVILPGLDRFMDDGSWDMIGDAKKAPSSFGHPQFALKRLMSRLALDRNNVKELGTSNNVLLSREQLVSQALRPAETTELWNSAQESDPEGLVTTALENVSLIESATEREEALAIAIALRGAIDVDRRRTAALVTNDRNLARRVSAELLRFGITADDSGGLPLSNSPQANLFQLILQAVFADEDPAQLLALLKHPLALYSQSKSKILDDAYALELIALRGTIGRVRAEALVHQVDKALNAAKKPVRPPFWKTRLNEGQCQEARALAVIVQERLAPLCALRDNGKRLSVPVVLRTSIEVLESIAINEGGSLAGFYAGDSGEQFASHLRGLLTADDGFEFEPADWPSVHAALMTGKMIKPKSGSDPNVFIWGALEARLQEVDTLVLGGLNESGWPARPGEDPFLSRGMKSSMQLDPPERRIGQSAHDFVMGLGTKYVILSRATRVDGVPTIASRWLLRLIALIGKRQTAELQHRGRQYLNWAQELDKLGDVDLEKRPEPSPPLELRPKHFSITDVEKLRRDPYSIYARDVLKLRPLEPLIRDPDERERGTLFHEIMANFISCDPDLANETEAAQKLRTIANDVFVAQQLPHDIHALWWPRFDELIPDIIAMERGRKEHVAQSFVEIKAHATKIAETGVTLSGRADRIDVLADNRGLDIIDYKTGSTNTAAQARKLVEPQLALEAALAKKGAFREFDIRHVNDLAYYRLQSRGNVTLDRLTNGKEVNSADALGDLAWHRLTELAEYYNKSEAKYVSQILPAKNREGDYDHLARVLEWSSGSDDQVEASDE
jgi:ATP-dependent helicase/nuclease subunit B